MAHGACDTLDAIGRSSVHEGQFFAATKLLALIACQLARLLGRSQNGVTITRYDCVTLVSDKIIVVLVLAAHRLERVN